MKGYAQNPPPTIVIDAERIPLACPGVPFRACGGIGITSGGDIFYGVDRSIFMYASRDGGRSFDRGDIEIPGITPIQPQTSTPGLGINIGFGVAPDDALLRLYLKKEPDSLFARLWCARSEDEGRTWNPGSKLDTTGFKCHPGQEATSFMGHPDGAVSVIIDLRYGEDCIHDADGKALAQEHKGLFQFLYRSRDGGRTWPERDLLMRHGAESSTLHLGEKKMMAAIRYQRWFDEPDDPPDLRESMGMDANGEVIYKHLFLADSEDDGRTWQNLRPLTWHGACPGELVKLSDDRIVVIYNVRYPHEKAHVRAQVSSDGGRTWSADHYLISSGDGYPSSVVLPDDTIVTMTGCTQLNAVGKPLEAINMNAVRWKVPQEQS